ncbi:unannotated protein [freshwater metagenome]|uniref:Unannotated protein n=1 Tax=freshwater metagenome TaxID=449393 RepID=A0A6J7HUT6_9ZZZZ
MIDLAWWVMTARPEALSFERQQDLPERPGEQTLLATDIDHDTGRVEHDPAHMPESGSDQHIQWIELHPGGGFATMRNARVERFGRAAQRGDQRVLERGVIAPQVHRRFEPC